MTTKYITYNDPFTLESGKILPEITIAYHTYGKLNQNKDNVIWVCHALTANSNVFDWWGGLFGEKDYFNPKEHYIVCANILGSCYGSTGPLSLNPKTGKFYGHDFPQLTVRDLIKAHFILKNHLGIEKIKLTLGCSLGGMQAIEWAISLGEDLEYLGLLATNAVFSPWGIAFNESQRWAIENDPTWKTDSVDAGIEGMKIARSMALLSYRNYITYHQTQSENSNDKLDGFKASSYQRYQGLKLSRRFNAYTYWHLTKIMDSHNIARNRGSIQNALDKIKAKTIVVGMPTDILFPINEQIFLKENIKGAEFYPLESNYGHDGFLIEKEKLSHIFKDFFIKHKTKEVEILADKM